MITAGEGLPPALILAGGQGTRLRAVVADRPKVMAEVAGQPFLAHQIAYLRAQGVTRIVLLVGYRHEQVRQHFGDGAAWGVHIEYAVEATPLGTAGAIKHAAPWLTGPALVLNGDSYCAVDLAALAAAHARWRAGDGRCVGTLALVHVDDGGAFGRVVLAGDRIASFAEKDAGGAAGWVNAGVYLFEPALLTWIEAGRPVSLEHETLPRVLAGGDHLYGFRSEGYFVDIGTPAGYSAYQRHVAGATSAAPVDAAHQREAP